MNIADASDSASCAYATHTVQQASAMQKYEIG